MKLNSIAKILAIASLVGLATPPAMAAKEKRNTHVDPEVGSALVKEEADYVATLDGKYKIPHFKEAVRVLKMTGKKLLVMVFLNG